MARPKAAKRPVVPRLETALTATPERIAKPAYSRPASSRKKCDHLLNLRKAGDLDAEAETLACRWRNDYEFGTHGYGDFMRGPLPDDYIKGDAITFATSRGYACERIGLVRDSLGVDAHNLLVQLLSDDLSFAEIARMMFPDLNKTNADKAVRQRAVMLLQILPNAYKAACRAQWEKKSLVDKSRCTLAMPRSKICQIHKIAQSKILHQSCRLLVGDVVQFGAVRFVVNSAASNIAVIGL
ncbi:hypothetical protein JCM15831A_11220 [Asaia astilbis]